MEKLEKKAVVVHSGGMDSSLCLKLAINEHGAENVLSLSFTYGQRHGVELKAAKKICQDWGVDHTIVNIDCLNQITSNALTNHNIKIEHNKKQAPNTLVVGRNGLMARVASIHAESIGANNIYMGVIEVEEANSGYRDCSRKYMDLIQEILRIDFANEKFDIITPLVFMTKYQTMQLGYELGILEYLLETTISCYEGIEKAGCGNCPACNLRNEGIKQFVEKNPSFTFSYIKKLK